MKYTPKNIIAARRMERLRQFNSLRPQLRQFARMLGIRMLEKFVQQNKGPITMFSFLKEVER